MRDKTFRCTNVEPDAPQTVDDDARAMLDVNLLRPDKGGDPVRSDVATRRSRRWFRDR